MSAAYASGSMRIATDSMPADSDDWVPAPPPKLRDGTPRSSQDSQRTGELPATPTTPSYASETKSKKANPLVDLIDTEKTFVDLLTGIIRKVASAWSRSNLPPPELDVMFRGIEAIFKANRGLLARLNDIGTNPSSPKALGDLLMRWIDDLESPYTNYCTKYCSGFDSWDAIRSNDRLPSILATFSAANPPPLPPGSPDHPSEPLLWTLDSLFLLPRHRIKYYRKLYGRLLKGSVPGRSDHRLLVGAVDKLDQLLATLDERSEINVAVIRHQSLQSLSPEDEVVIDMRHRQSAAQPSVRSNTEASSQSTSFHGSDSTGPRSFGETPLPSTDRLSSETMLTPISDLERRLSTERCIDIFTMQPKQVRLQITPPGLTFTREVLASADVQIFLTPRATGVEVAHRHGHIYILTDLFLVCERIRPEDQWPDGPDMSLCYPPLAGKHLRVSMIEGPDNAFQVVIMKKETLNIHFGSKHARDQALAAFRECVDFAGTVSKQPPPPMPPLNHLPPAEHANFDSAHASRPPSEPNSSPINTRTGTPASGPPSAFPEERTMSPLSRGSSRSEDRVQPLAMNPVSPPERTASLNHPSNQHGQPFAPVPQPPPKHTGPGQILTPPPPGGPGQFGGPPRSASAGPNFAPPRQSFASGSSGGDVPPGGFGRGGPNGFPPVPPGAAQLPPGPRILSPPNGAGLGGPYPGHGPHVQGGPPEHHMHPQPGLPAHPGGPGMLRKASSSGALAAQFERAALNAPHPPMPGQPGGPPPHTMNGFPARGESLPAPQPRAMLPSALNARVASMATMGPDASAEFDISPPASPVQSIHRGPVTSTISAQMRCKIFLQQHHSQWKSLGSAKLKLYLEQPTMVKQLVVEAEDKKSTVLISTIVLSDGVERVGKTGVAVELSDNGVRTGIIYMLQCKNETSAGSLFDSLLQGSDRHAK